MDRVRLPKGCNKQCYHLRICLSIALRKPQNATKDTNLETRPAAPAFSTRKLCLSNPGPSDENKTENASITRLH